MPDQNNSEEQRFILACGFRGFALSLWPVGGCSASFIMMDGHEKNKAKQNFISQQAGSRKGREVTHFKDTHLQGPTFSNQTPHPPFRMNSSMYQSTDEASFHDLPSGDHAFRA